MSRQGVKKREKRLKRIFGVSTIILSLLIAFIPNFVYAATDSNDDQGIHWDVSGDTLTISAVATPGAGVTAGEIPDYTSNPQPWNTYSGSISNVIIQNTVTDLGPNFPSNLGISNISSLTINGPSTIKRNSINLSSLTINTLTFGEGVTTIAEDAVKNADKITRLVLPSSLTSLNEKNFYTLRTGTDYPIREIVTAAASAGESFLNSVNKKIIAGTYKNTYNSGSNDTLIACYHESGSGIQRDSKVYIDDTRTSPLNSPNVSAKMANPDDQGDYILHIRDITSSDKDSMQNLMKKSIKESMFFDLILTDSTGNTVQKTVNITIPYPAAWSNGTVQAVYTYLSILENAPTTPVTGASVNCVTIKADHFSPYALTYTEAGSQQGGGSTEPTSTPTTETPTSTGGTTPTSTGGTTPTSTGGTTPTSTGGTTPTSTGGTTPTSTGGTTPTSTPSSTPSSTGGKKSSSSQEKTYTITVKDERTEKTDSRYISAKVTHLDQNLVLVVKDSDGAEIQKSLVVPNKGIVKYVDLDLQNDKGEGVVGYGTCTVVLPIPQEMDLTKGSVKVMAFNADNALKEISSKIVEVSGKKCVRFNPPHFSEFALVYTPFSGNTSNGNGGNNSATGNKVIMPKTGGGDEIRYILSAFLFLFGTVQLITSVTRKKSTVR